MSGQGYKKIEKFFRERGGLYTALKVIYTVLPTIVFAAYPVLLVYLFINARTGNTNCAVFYKALIIPAFTLVTVSLVRKLINAPRPYEKYDTNPLIKKDKKGHSFPSRHSASVFIIAAAFLYVCLPLGVLFFCIGIIMCLSRVLAGVHFIKDVVAGAAYALLCGMMFSAPNEILTALLKGVGLYF